MRRILVFIVSVCWAVMLIPFVAMASGESNAENEGGMTVSSVEITEENFPDDIFRGFIATTYDVSGADGVLSQQELAEITDVRVSNLGIKSLKGIEYFGAITDLDCSNNELEELNLEENKLLRTLYCDGNSLIALDLSENEKLAEMSAKNQSRFVKVQADGSVDLAALSKDFDVRQVLDLSKGCVVEDNNLFFNDELINASYRYKCSNGCYIEVELVREDLWMEPIEEELVYCGKSVDPTPFLHVYHAGTLLTVNKDYSVTIKNNIRSYTFSKGSDQFNARKAPTVTIKGKGNYSGSVSRTFVIAPEPISSELITVDDVYVGYTGKEIVPSPDVYRKGKKLVKNKDYVVYCEQEILEPGSYTIDIVGKGNFSGRRSCQLTVVDTQSGQLLMNKAVIAKIDKQMYTGNEIKPELIVKVGKKQLVEGKDYAVSYRNNIEIGQATAVVTGLGSYVGTKTVNFAIEGLSIAKATIKGLKSSVLYTGDEIIQKDIKLSLSVNGMVVNLVEDIDYTVDYTNNTNAGTAKMVVSGINKYTGVLKKTFSIKAVDISDRSGYGSDFEAYVEDADNVLYMKGGAKPKVNITIGGRLLMEGVDYTLGYKNNKQIEVTSGKKVPIVTIKGKGNYRGKIDLPFVIHKKSIDSVVFRVADKAESARAGKFKSTPVLCDLDGKVLKAGVDYEKTILYECNGIMLDSSSCPKAGDIISVTVTGKGKYTGSVTGRYRIIKANNDISKAKITVSGDVNTTYTGKPITLDKDDLMVMIGQKAISKSHYQIVGYQNNIQVGAAKVTVRGIGEYGGEKSINFIIKPKPINIWERFIDWVSPAKYYVSFADYDGKLLKVERVAKGMSAIPPAVPYREGYVFEGWKGNYQNVTADEEVVAIYEENGVDVEYTVSFTDYDGTLLKEERVKAGGDATPPEDPVREGYVFMGWEGNYQNVMADEEVVAIYEKDEADVEYTVSFTDYDGTLLKEERVKAGGNATPPEDPVREGYVFKGWSGNYQNVTADEEVVAIYEQVMADAEYVVTFEDYDGTVLKVEYVKWGGSATLPDNPTREGYTFVGWSCSHENIKSDLTIIAVYQIVAGDEEYIVNFLDSDETTIIETQVVNRGENAVAPTAPTKEGKLFVGWKGQYTKVDSDKTIIAMYVDKSTKNIMMVSSAEAEVGDTITVTIDLTGQPLYYMYQGELQYDSTSLEFVSMTQGTNISANHNESSSSIRFAYLNLSQFTSNYDTEMRILTATFKVKTTASPYLELGVSQAQIQGIDESYMDMTVVGGYVNIK